MTTTRRRTRRITVGIAASIAVTMLGVPGAAALAAPGAHPTQAIDQGRIQFAAGADSGTVTGTVAAGDWHEWKAWAGAGQTMSIAVTGNATLEVSAPSGTLLADDVTAATFELPATGDYIVSVGATGGDADYAVTLTITGDVPRPAPAPQPQPGGADYEGEIRFATGESSIVLSDSVAADGWDEWTFWAGEGQQVYAEASPGVTISLLGPDGAALFQHAADWGDAQAPASGVYRFQVGAGGAATDYRVELIIAGDVAPSRQGHFRGEIRFHPGTITGGAAATVTSPDWDVWTFWAAAGQPASLYTTGDATFSVQAPDGTLLASDTTRFDTTLPATGHYRLEVGSTGGTVAYRVQMVISG